MSPEQVIKQGAEARLYIGEINGNKCLIKERFIKKYRHPDLDAEINRKRMKSESRTITRCQSAMILVPKIYHVDLADRKIYMEYFEKSITAKEFIRTTVATENDINSQRTTLESLCDRIGTVIGTLHKNHIIHGDLTTSNILIDPCNDNFTEYNVILIDFGLSHYNESNEDKGVDLYVLERALISMHSEQTYLFPKILESYRKQYANNERNVVSKFEEVRARGRKRTMIG